MSHTAPESKQLKLRRLNRTELSFSIVSKGERPGGNAWQRIAALLRYCSVVTNTPSMYLKILQKNFTKYCSTVHYLNTHILMLVITI